MIYRGFASVFKSFFYNYHAESLIDILPFFLSFVCVVTWFQISLLKYSQTAGPYVRHQASNAEIENRWIFRFENEILSWKVRQQWVSLRSHLTKRLRPKTSKVLMNIASYTPFLCVIEYSIAFVSLLCALLDSKRNKSPKCTVLRFPVWKVFFYSISRFASRICYASVTRVLHVLRRERFSFCRIGSVQTSGTKVSNWSLVWWIVGPSRGLWTVVWILWNI